MQKYARTLTCCIALALCLPCAALAKKQQPQNIEFGAITCQEFIQELAQSDEDSAGIVLMWLDGYLSGISGDTTLNWKSLESFSGALTETCGKNPQKKVLDVARQVGLN